MAGERLISEYTLLIYLNGGPDGPPPVAGGETVFYQSAKRVLAEVAPRAGVALLHAHGRRCLMHAGSECGPRPPPRGGRR